MLIAPLPKILKIYIKHYLFNKTVYFRQWTHKNYFEKKLPFQFFSSALPLPHFAMSLCRKRTNLPVQLRKRSKCFSWWNETRKFENKNHGTLFKVNNLKTFMNNCLPIKIFSHNGFIKSGCFFELVFLL